MGFAIEHEHKTYQRKSVTLRPLGLCEPLCVCVCVCSDPMIVLAMLVFTP